MCVWEYVGVDNVWALIAVPHVSTFAKTFHFLAINLQLLYMQLTQFLVSIICVVVVVHHMIVIVIQILQYNAVQQHLQQHKLWLRRLLEKGLNQHLWHTLLTQIKKEFTNAVFLSITILSDYIRQYRYSVYFL